MSSEYNVLIGSTDTFNSLAGNTEGLVGGTGVAGEILGFVCGRIVERSTCQVFFMWTRRVSVDTGQYLLVF